MIPLKAHFPLIIGAIVITILLFLSWFFALQPFVTIVGVIAGAMISILSQLWTQRLAWKRDYSLKAIEQVYSPLYGVILEVEKVLGNNEYQNWSFGHWDSCRKDYRYFMVDEKFRERLDSFDAKMRSRGNAINILETVLIPRILNETAREVFPEKPNPDRSITFQINLYKQHELKGSYSINHNFHLKKQDSIDTIVEYAVKINCLKTESVDEACTKVTFRKADNPLDLFRTNMEKKGDFSQSDYFCNSEEKNLEFWSTCLKKTADTEELQFTVKANDILLKEAKAIKDTLIKRIEKPWRQ